jgi:lipopolysaccharide/colanic/teichoic acid biosynthesis glycosyltransferase
MPQAYVKNLAVGMGMNFNKRCFDVLLAVVLILPIAMVSILVTFAVLICDGRPIFYKSERMKTLKQSFMLVKFRTMQVSDVPTGVAGGAMMQRVSPLGHILRRLRLDELPQIWNVLRGDLSFVGPRPPLPCHVEQFPGIYEKVLAIRPGITGLATLVFHKHEHRILGHIWSQDLAERIYLRRCIGRKARLDMIYANRQSRLLDTIIILKTLNALSCAGLAMAGNGLQTLQKLYQIRALRQRMPRAANHLLQYVANPSSVSWDKSKLSLQDRRYPS